MPQTKEGAKKAQKKIKEKYGLDKQGRSIFHSQIGQKGGKKCSKLKGFGSNRKLAIEAGKKGGSISRKGKK